MAENIRNRKNDDGPRTPPTQIDMDKPVEPPWP